MEFAKPKPEHTWLQQLVGDWTYESECVMGPDQPKGKFTGTETVRSLGGLWIVGEGKGQTPDGGSADMLLTVGFDPATGRYVGTWVGSMMTKLWNYDGWREGETLILAADGPSFTDPAKTAHYRDVTELKSPDHRVFTSSVQGDDGQWFIFMTSHYRRVK